MAVTWVAEIGSMHKGNKDLAHEMIRRAAEAGATIAKFQFGWTKETQAALGLEYKAVRYVDDWAEDLRRWCDYYGVELMASIWSREGLAVAESVGMRRYKIAAQKAGDYDLCKDIYSNAWLPEKPVYVSLDRHSPHTAYHMTERHNFLWCKSKYPVYPEDIAPTPEYPGMPTEFGSPWHGYSDHMHGTEACLLAVARGARYIEKHFCLDKTDLMVRDTVFSATPGEFAEMVRIGNGLHRLTEALR